jgi:polar amino acid transport system substrate-binding protein
MAFPAVGHSQSPLRIAFPVFPPFHWVDDHGAMKGLFYDIISEALEKRMGISVTWTAYPWKRCQENLKAGIDDAILTVPTAERSTYTVTHTHPFYYKPLNLFTYAGHPRLMQIKSIHAIADLKRGDFAVITYSGNGWNKKNVESLGVKTYETPYLESVWKMLAQKRGDVVIEWPPGAWPDIDRLGLADRIIDTGTTLASMPFHLLIRKNSYYTTILDHFDATIVQMYSDGIMSMILSRYE